MRVCYVGDGPLPVLAFHHAPPGAARETGVLLCPPFGWDEVCSYRPRRVLAERLAAAGFPALRLDLPGTGDSPGGPRDPGLVPAWLAAVRDGASWLRGTGCRRVTGFGLGIGGLLAWEASAGGAPIDELVLWATPASGRAAVRELRAFARFEAAWYERAGVAPPPPPPADEVVAGGFLLGAETAEALAAVVPSDGLRDGAVRRLLLLGRDGPPARVLQEAAEAAGAAVSTDPGDGFAPMMAEPQEAVAPLGTFDRIIDWLEAAPRPAPGASAPAPPRDEEVLRPREESYEERPLILDVGPRLFGIECRPASGDAGDHGLLLLNPGAQRRIGPNRMWVEAARRWARRGVSSVRLDVEGLGDAEGDAGAYGDVARFYNPAMVDQVAAVLDRLAQDGPRWWTLAGLCSGAYYAFHVAVADPRVVAAVMLNPRALYWSRELDEARVQRQARRTVRARSSWRRAARGELKTGQLAALARSLGRSALPGPGRRDQRAEGAQALEAALDTLRDRGTLAVLAFSGDEPLREELEAEGVVYESQRWPNVEFPELPGRIHTLRPPFAQEEGHAVIDRALLRASGVVRSRACSGPPSSWSPTTRVE